MRQATNREMNLEALGYAVTQLHERAVRSLSTQLWLARIFKISEKAGTNRGVEFRIFVTGPWAKGACQTKR